MENATTPVPCPCCNSADLRPRWTLFVVCPRCGLMRYNELLSSDELKRFYQEDYFQGGEYINYLEDKPVQQKTLGRHLNLVRRYLPPGGRLLEIGCAYGFFLEMIAAEYPNSVGIDVFSAGIRGAQRRGFDARAGDLLEMDIAERFDAVCLWDTIEHLPRPRELCEKAAQLLRPGGHLFLTTGDFGSLFARLRGRKWRQIHPPTHVFYFTRRSLRELCSRAGLEVVEFRTVRIYRRLGSALRSLATFHPGTVPGRLASILTRTLPDKVLGLDFPLNLGDTLSLVAKKPEQSIRSRGARSTAAG